MVIDALEADFAVHPQSLGQHQSIKRRNSARALQVQIVIAKQNVHLRNGA